MGRKKYSLAALDLAHILRERALTRNVPESVAIATFHHALLVALGSAVARFLAVTAELGLAVGTVLGEVTH